jgi:diguanylate cyclase (GGDEF)-like protein/PAS domain S-box-containing protein
MMARASSLHTRLGGYQASFATIVVVFGAVVIALAVFLSTKIGEQSARVSLTIREREGLAYTARILKTVRALRALRDRLEFEHDAATAQRHDVTSALDDLDSFGDVSGRPFDLTKRVAVLEGQWAEVPAGVAGAASVADVLSTASTLSEVAGDRSSLVADPDGATAALVDAYASQLPIVADRIDDAKLELYRAERSGQLREPNRVAVATLIGEARQAFLSADNEIDNASRTLGDLPRTSSQISSIGDSLDVFSMVLDRARDSSTKRSDADALRAVADSVIDAVDLAYDGLSSTIDERLLARQQNEERILFLLRAAVVFSVVLGATVVIFLGGFLRRRHLRELERSRAALERLEAELEQQRVLEALAVTEAHFRAAFDRSSIGVVILDRSGTVIRTNARIMEMMDSIDAEVVGVLSAEYARLFTGEIDSFTTEVYREPADTWFEASVSLVRDDDQTPRFAISMVKDVTERKKIADRFRHDARHDALSGLPNRACFSEYLESKLGETEEGVRAVLFIDIDEFKLVNDSYGHSAGDRVIVWCAEQLRANVRAGDFVARLGGDEFVAFVTGRDRASIEDTARRVGDALSETLVLDGQDIFVTASIGIAFVDHSYTSTDDILRDADTAMYTAKSGGGHARFSVFDISMREDVSRKMTLSVQLRRALEREQFYLVYQPVVSLSTGSIDSFEVLLRWEHPELGNVSPVEFIPLAEELGLIVPIGRYVLDRACKQFASWKRDFPQHRPRRIAVNASVREISQGDYVDSVRETLARHGISPDEVVLEVTESAVLASNRSSSGPLERLKDVGVGLAIDDFGTGFSSLRYLQQFPFDVLKIDRSFVGGEDGGLASEPIVTMLLALAETCGVTVTAEGVETAAQAKRLRELGCEDVQGWYFGRPARAADVPNLFYSIAAIAS